MVVVDGERRPVGVFTLGDVLTRVALPQIPLETPISRVMSPRVHTAPAHAPAFEAALLMARENVRHVPLVEQGRLVEVPGATHLFEEPDALNQVRKLAAAWFVRYLVAPAQARVA
jgi:CBS domain-containing protein